VGDCCGGCPPCCGGADLRGADLTGADLEEATMWEANLTGAFLLPQPQFSEVA